MKFTPTQNYNLISKALARELEYNVYHRITKELSGSLALNDWTGSTEYISDIPDISAKLEYNAGNYTADGISLTAFDIPYWKTNVFTDSLMDDDTTYVEFKITITPKLGTIISEVVTPFFGFVNKDAITYEEKSNTVKFGIYTPELLADKTPAYTLNTQYIYNSNSGSVLILPRIPGLYVRNANYNSLPLKTGLHKLTYDADAETIKLDEGVEWFISSSDTLFVLGDADATNRDLFGNTQELEMYYEGPIISQQNSTMEEYLIVTNQGATLPQQPYYTLNLNDSIDKIYTKMGCGYTKSDNFIISSSDGTRRYSYVATPPSNSVNIDVASCMERDGTGSVYYGIGSKIYVSDYTPSSSFTLVASSSNDVKDGIIRLSWNNYTKNLWTHFASSSGKDFFRPIQRTGLPGSYTYTHRPLPTGVDNCDYVKPENTCIYNFSYGSGPATEVHGLAVVKDIEDSGNGPFDFGQGLYIIKEGTAPFAYRIDRYIFMDPTDYSFNSACIHQFDRNIYVICDTVPWGNPPLFVGIATPNNAGIWGRLVGDYNLQVTGSSNFTANENNSMIWNKDSFNPGYYYYFTSGSYHSTSSNSVQQIRRTSGSVDQLVRDFPKGNYEYIGGVASIGYPRDINATESRTTLLLVNKDDISEYVLTDALFQNPTITYSNMIVPETSAYALQYLTDTYYFLDFVGQLYNLTTTPAMFVASTFQYAELSLREYLNKLLSAFNLLGTINSNKQAKVYRRTNETGRPVFSGNSASLSTDNVSDFIMNYENYKAAKVINLTAENDKKTSYDGTNFDVGYFSNARVVDVTSDVIPQILYKDLATHFYNFFAEDHSVVKLVSVDMMFQYEPFDACYINLPMTKIGIDKTGVIYSITFKKDGTTQLEVLINNAATEPPLYEYVEASL